MQGGRGGRWEWGVFVSSCPPAMFLQTSTCCWHSFQCCHISIGYKRIIHGIESQHTFNQNKRKNKRNKKNQKKKKRLLFFKKKGSKRKTKEGGWKWKKRGTERGEKRK